jgi:hypothetical protein
VLPREPLVGIGERGKRWKDEFYVLEHNLGNIIWTPDYTLAMEKCER